MPYVTQQIRDDLDSGVPPRTPGELTYLIYRAMLAPPEEATLEEAVDYAVQGYMARGPLSFGTLNTVIGSLECARREHFRRNPEASSARPRAAIERYATDFYWTTVAPYEEQKIAENGDVYA